MWKVTPHNAPAVLVGSSSAIACALGALTAHILTKNALKAKYEALVEAEVQTAKAYFSMRHKTGAYADPVKLAEERLGKDEVETEYVEKVQQYTGREEHIQKPEIKHVSKPRPEEDDEPLHLRSWYGRALASGMEAFEQRLIDEAKQEVDGVKQKLGIFEEEDEPDEEEEVITMNIFSENESSASSAGGRDTNRPFILSAREFEDGELDYSQNTLTYYEGDDVLTDERDQPIHHLQKIVGAENLKFGEMSDDPNIVYIRNNELEVDFEVCRSKGTFTEEVLGFSEPSNKPRPRKFREYD